ncbi:hypothetical protein Asi02nite_05190 [Asanoa siamensis]|uniref:Uncharacterized protein n=1 Tax=Asanoa siamensis TaxID=926357 RepID=A0ABQ4CI69_9ACTN|nr:hypothetical protein Asi02nite_05190 [Asanoa siamensis]
MTRDNWARYGESRRNRRFADGTNVMDFSVGMPADIHGGPPPAGRRPAAGSRPGVAFAGFSGAVMLRLPR